MPKGGGHVPPQILADQKAPPAGGGARRITVCPPRFLDFGTCLTSNSSTSFPRLYKPRPKQRLGGKLAQHIRSLYLNIINVILANVFGEEKFYWLPSNSKWAGENFALGT